MTAKEISKIWEWLDRKLPGATPYDLERVAEQYFGKIKWSSQMGYGEGMVICEFPDRNVEGISQGGDPTSQEALLEALHKLI